MNTPKNNFDAEAVFQAALFITKREETGLCDHRFIELCMTFNESIHTIVEDIDSLISYNFDSLLRHILLDFDHYLPALKKELQRRIVEHHVVTRGDAHEWEEMQKKPESSSLKAHRYYGDYLLWHHTVSQAQEHGKISHLFDDLQIVDHTLEIILERDGTKRRGTLVDNRVIRDIVRVILLGRPSTETRTFKPKHA